jgi:hypothetical protein
VSICDTHVDQTKITVGYSISPFLMYKNELTIIAVNINPFSFPKAMGWIDAMGSRYVVTFLKSS